MSDRSPSSLSPGLFMTRVMGLLERVTYVPAETSEQKEEIYHLRYEANLREGSIEAHPDQRLVDKFDEDRVSINYGIYIDNQLLAALRILILHPHTSFSPLLEVFEDVLLERIKKDGPLIDGNRFVVNYTHARSYPQLPYVTLRLSTMAADHIGANYMVGAVRTEHVAFYRREWGAEALCEPRPYPTLVKPLSLIFVPYRKDRDAILQRRPFYDSSLAERQKVFGSHLDRL